jgi:hypothetical protein
LQPRSVLAKKTDLIALEQDRTGQIRRDRELLQKVIDHRHPDGVHNCAIGKHGQFVDCGPRRVIFRIVVGDEDKQLP